MLRFTIRDLLWVTVVVALGAAWWVDHSKTQRQLSKLAESEQRVLFYMNLVQRLQAENYKLKRDAQVTEPVTVEPSVDQIPGDPFNDLRFFGTPNP